MRKICGHGSPIPKIFNTFSNVYSITGKLNIPHFVAAKALEDDKAVTIIHYLTVALHIIFKCTLGFGNRNLVIIVKLFFPSYESCVYLVACFSGDFFFFIRPSAKEY